MLSRERVLMAIAHEEPDKVPLDCWLAPQISEELTKALNLDLSKDRFAFPKSMGHDMLCHNLGIGGGFNSIYMPDRKIAENLYQDNWGIKWRRKNHDYGSYCEFAEHPLADISNYDKYKWPDPTEIEKADFKICEELISTSGDEYAIMGGVFCTIFEASWFLRGMENFLMDLYVNRDFAIELLDKTMNYHLQVSKKLVEMGVDIIFWGDDIGCEKGPLIDPKLYREIIKPRYAHMVQEVRKINKNIKIAYHTDGNIEWALDDLVELGFDILNPLQPDVNDVKMVKKRYGKKITIWGNVDTRTVMAKGTCAEVVQEVKKVIEILGPGGGLILCSNHGVQSTRRAVDNTIAFYWAAEKFRNYPIVL